VSRLQFWIPAALGGTPSLPTLGEWTFEFEALRGTVPALVSVVGIHALAILEIIYPMTWLLILRLSLRRTAPALVVIGVLGAILFYPATGSVPGYIVGWVVTMALFWGALFGFGLLAFAAMYHVFRLLDEAGKVVPVIDRRYKLSEVADAIRYLEQGHARGKVIITV
jgi:hypothetical protein